MDDPLVQRLRTSRQPVGESPLIISSFNACTWAATGVFQHNVHCFAGRGVKMGVGLCRLSRGGNTPIESVAVGNNDIPTLHKMQPNSIEPPQSKPFKASLDYRPIRS